MSKKAILFVDDEPNILSGIKRMLRSMRKEYDFYFAESGKEALEIMASNAIEAVVSDMRMPGMDGAEFLTQVKEHYPQAIRIMLTGQADEESVYRTISVVHQFLSKPCDPDTLKEILIRSCALRDLLSSEHLKEIVSGIDHLPSLPAVFTELQFVLKKEDATAEQVAEIIEQDIGMTAKLLQLVNSSFFGLFQKVDSPARAVKLLGFDTIKILVLGVQIFSEIKTNSAIISVDFLQEHSMKVAQCSKKIAFEATDDPDLINNCFLAGMLHDIGRLLLLSQLAEAYMPIVETAKTNETNLATEERNQLNATHGDIGAYLIGLWGFNGDILEAIAYHNNLSAYPRNSFSAAVAVHVADALYYVHYPEKVIGLAPVLDRGYIEKIGLSDSLEKWSEVCTTIFESDDE
jgi:HD-like signal output (HDOD) protein